MHLGAREWEKDKNLDGQHNGESPPIEISIPSSIGSPVLLSKYSHFRKYIHLESFEGLERLGSRKFTYPSLRAISRSLSEISKMCSLPPDG
jgi:hypothetical protein